MTGSRPGTLGVLGLARSGLAAARLALATGRKVYASDAADNAATREAAAEVRRLGGSAETGGHDIGQLARCATIVASPGIPPAAPVFNDSRLSAVPVISEIEFAWRNYHGQVIAITGTNGKSTVTELTAHLLRSAGVGAEAGGNVGIAFSELLLREPVPEVTVVETSSFQLGRCYDFAPGTGVLTNLAPDHLDSYPDLDAYYADKARLFQNATPASRWVLNGDAPKAAGLPGNAAGQRFYFQIQKSLESGQHGGFLRDGILVLRTARGAEEPLLPASSLPLFGPHNISNSLAAAIAARLSGASAESIAAGLRTFAGLAHCLQPIGEVDGVLWINDSKATNVASAKVALRAMTRPAVVLLGGRHKGEPYSELIGELREHAKVVLAFGEAAPVITGELAGHVRVEPLAASFEDVIRRARQIASPGDAVLLAPACSSFDMFRDYAERGEQFARLALMAES